jgi:hypothetical protein
LLKYIAVATLLSSFLLCISPAAQTTSAAPTPPPERKVEGNIITSAHDPSVRIQLPPSVHYVGADRWVLYGIADCELHAFVDVDEHKPDDRKNVQRLYWVQFESYVPTRPELQHTYDSPRHATLGGLDFYVDTSVRANDAPRQSGSDRGHIEALIGSHGYSMPAGVMYVRLVHLLDEQKRKELMIIYGEDLAPTGLTAADLAPGGKAHDRWPDLEKSLIEHAEKRITIEPTPAP